jgi:hypothetical protein
MSLPISIYDEKDFVLPLQFPLNGLGLSVPEKVGENFFGKISTLLPALVQQHKGTNYFIDFLLGIG